MGNGGRVGMYINNQSCIPFIAFDNCGCFRAAIIIYIFCTFAVWRTKRKRKQSKYTSVSLKLSNTERENEREKVKK